MDVEAFRTRIREVTDYTGGTSSFQSCVYEFIDKVHSTVPHGKHAFYLSLLDRDGQRQG